MNAWARNDTKKVYARVRGGSGQYIEAVEPAATPEGTESAPGATPTSPRGWEPGIPSVRELAPSVIGGGLIPLGAYYLFRHAVSSDADALIIAGLFSAAWILVQFIRKRTFDPVGMIVLFGFAIGVLVSTLLGGNAYVLKIRDSVFTAIFGLACLVSLFSAKRPAIFYVGRFLSAGNDPERMAAYDELHELPTGQHTFRVLTLVWGIGLFLEASTRLILAAVLPTGIFLPLSGVNTGVWIGGMFLFTVRYTNRARALSQSILADEQPVPPAPTA
jgi:hypothetical protein